MLSCRSRNIKNCLKLVYSSHLNNPDSTVISDFVTPGVLTASGLLFLLNILKTWAGFFPDHPLAIVIELIKKTERNSAQKNENSKSEEVSKSSEILIEELDILNSFYIEDLEKIIKAYSTQSKALLTQYILGIDDQTKKNVYSQKNARYISEKLNPDQVNHGRWPQGDYYSMSLMQQLAINENFHLKADQTLFSVNGPPGTGKTTLLQDIIAENIVRRACVLSEFESSLGAFKGKLEIHFTQQSKASIDLLDERLTGFEMLIVSSNNAAVENISKELPLLKKYLKNIKQNFNI